MILARAGSDSASFYAFDGSASFRGHESAGHADIQLVLSTPVVLWAGWSFLCGAINH